MFGKASGFLLSVNTFLPFSIDNQSNKYARCTRLKTYFGIKRGGCCLRKGNLGGQRSHRRVFKGGGWRWGSRRMDHWGWWLEVRQSPEAFPEEVAESGGVIKDSPTRWLVAEVQLGNFFGYQKSCTQKNKDTMREKNYGTF